MRYNPFYELYLADSMPAGDFVTLFSPFLIPHVQQLFLPGNVVIVGMQGSGKSMLLTLLRHETRFKYAEAGEEFPVPKQYRNFITCSVNLTHSNATDFGNRRWREEDPAEVEFLFGDFVNSLLVSDLLDTLWAYSSARRDLRNEAGVHLEGQRLDEFAVGAVQLSSWRGWLEGVENFETLRKRLELRVHEFRSFLHRRRKDISDEVLSTRTAMGDPIGEYAGLLRSTGLISENTNVFVDIDQYEELANIKNPDGRAEPIDYRSVINRALSRRDPRVSYRVGSRRHSWRTHGKIVGSIGKLESERDYKYIDLDILLKRSESSKTYIFPRFAEDVFQRRMQVAGVVADRSRISLAKVYGTALSAEAKAKLYNSGYAGKAVKLEKSWHPATKRRLIELAQKDPLSARLGEAWLRQKGEVDLDMNDDDLPWNGMHWWRKERMEIALLQIASSNQQRPIYSGNDEICELSSGNILVFISINQHIWDQYIKFEANAPMKRRDDVPRIGIDLQSKGIFEASAQWMVKLEEETGRSAARVGFVKEVARVLRSKVVADRSLSNPGATGFSLREDELSQLQWIRDFLGELSDYGNFLEVSHTTKEKDRASRVKWYISPILCPTLRLPFVRTKEPYYAKLTDLLAWLSAAGVTQRIGNGKLLARQAQGSLFEE